MHNKRHWDYKSFMTPQANKSVFTSLYIQHPAVSGPRNFRTSKSISMSHSSTSLRAWRLRDINMFTTALHSPKQTEKRPRVQETFHNWYRWFLHHTVHLFNTTCNVRARNNFKFMFQLMTVGLLNTEGFHNLKYCIRSKGFLEHLETLLYPTVLEISAFGVKL